MDFVDFNLAKKLKEKGFDWDRITTYNPRTKVRNNHLEPTISQVLKWLREEKKLHIIIPASFDEGYWWEIRDFNREISEYSDIEYTSYEAAVIASIECCLNNLI